MADRVESVIREKIVYLAGRPGGGHWRKDLTDEPVKFFPVYSYLIVYRPETIPLQLSPFSMAAATWRSFSRIVSNKLNARLTAQSNDSIYHFSPCRSKVPISRTA
jgi:hypothetical protein